MAPPTLPKHEQDAPAGGGKKQMVMSVLRDWLKETWVDVLTMGALAAAAMGIYQAPLAATRTFAVSFTESGDIVYPEFAYPDRGWIIPVWLSAVLSVGVPGIIILLAQFRIRSFRDTNSAIIGLLYSMILSTLFQVVMKMLVGGFRPYFLEVCKPDISQSYIVAHNSSGLAGVGFHQLYFSSEICTTEDKAKLKTAMTSFPSGHSTAAWAGFAYLFLYLNAKLKVWADYRPAVWKVPVVFAPLLGATLISCSLSIDGAHNWYDIAIGGVIGTVFAFACYRMVFAAVWDWRFNHIPLQPGENFLYATGKEMQRDYALFTHRAGWGPGVVDGGMGAGAGAGALGEKNLQRRRGGSPKSNTTSDTTTLGNGHRHEGKTSKGENGLRVPPHAATQEGAGYQREQQQQQRAGFFAG